MMIDPYNNLYDRTDFLEMEDICALCKFDSERTPIQCSSPVGPQWNWSELTCKSFLSKSPSAHEKAEHEVNIAPIRRG